MTVDELIEVQLPDEESFLKIKETLTRIGIASREKALYQSCHILHKQGKYYIIHFKQLFMLDGKPSNFSEEDQARTNTIANLLAQWGLVTITTPDKWEKQAPLSQIKVIAFKDKSQWNLVSKYTIGKKKKDSPQPK